MDFRYFSFKNKKVSTPPTLSSYCSLICVGKIKTGINRNPEISYHSALSFLNSTSVFFIFYHFRLFYLVHPPPCTVLSSAPVYVRVEIVKKLKLNLRMFTITTYMNSENISLNPALFAKPQLSFPFFFLR